MRINNVDRIRGKVACGELCVGTSVTFTDPAVSELIGDAGYDFTWIDMEHCPIDIESALGHVMAVRGTGAAPFIRVPAASPVILKPVLELHPAAVIIPQVRSLRDVEEAVAACKYPPSGVRGFGPRRGRGFGGTPYPEYLETADEQILVFVQIEHVDAADAISDILTVAGLDGVCLGFNDLAGSMGLSGQTTDERVVAVSEDVIRRTADSDKWMGISMGWDPVSVPRWIGLGLQWISVGTDFTNLYEHSSRVLEKVRNV